MIEVEVSEAMRPLRVSNQPFIYCYCECQSKIGDSLD
jgi:hypothetical protein